MHVSIATAPPLGRKIACLGVANYPLRVITRHAKFWSHSSEIGPDSADRPHPVPLPCFVTVT